MPVALKANWMFRVTERQPAAPYHAGTRAAAFIAGLWPVVALAPLHAWLWGWSIAGYHAAVGGCYALCVVELLFASSTAIPFTAPHVSGRLRLKTRWPVYVLAPSILAGAPSARARSRAPRLRSRAVRRLPDAHAVRVEGLGLRAYGSRL
jgi:hypothetical protein